MAVSAFGKISTIMVADPTGPGCLAGGADALGLVLLAVLLTGAMMGYFIGIYVGRRSK